jgi:hypothetical protein
MRARITGTLALDPQIKDMAFLLEAIQTINVLNVFKC